MFYDFALELTDLSLQTHLVAVARHSFLSEVAQGSVDLSLVNVHRRIGACKKAELDRHDEQIQG